MGSTANMIMLTMAIHMAICDARRFFKISLWVIFMRPPVFSEPGNRLARAPYQDVMFSGDLVKDQGGQHLLPTQNVFCEPLVSLSASFILGHANDHPCCHREGKQLSVCDMVSLNRFAVDCVDSCVDSCVHGYFLLTVEPFRCRFPTRKTVETRLVTFQYASANKPV